TTSSTTLSPPLALTFLKLPTSRIQIEHLIWTAINDVGVPTSTRLAALYQLIFLVTHGRAPSNSTLRFIHVLAHRLADNPLDVKFTMLEVKKLKAQIDKGR